MLKNHNIIPVILLIISMISCKNNTKTDKGDSKILINHVSYQIGQPKRLVFQTQSDKAPEKFRILDKKGKTVYESAFEKGGKISQWHTGNAYAGDFTELNTEGQFYIITDYNDQTIKSESFVISGNKIRNECLPLLIQGFQSERCAPPYDTKDRKMSFFGQRNDTVDVHGGWYDASGEKGKYLSHLCFSNYFNPQQTPMVVWNMLESAELYSGSGQEKDKKLLKELLDEAVYGSDFLVRMQDKEGYFYTNVFAGWTADPDQREICAFEGQDGKRTEDYQAAFREGGGISIAALARTAKTGITGDYDPETYLNTAIKGFDHLLKYNMKYVDDGKENIIDKYTALLAATELFNTTGEKKYLEHARNFAKELTGYLRSDGKYDSWWSADSDGKRPYFHAAEAGLPLISLYRYLQIEKDDNFRDMAISAINKSVNHEIKITGEVNNPFGYARQYVKSPGSEKYASFFIPHKNETGYWWQGEDARLASLAAAFNLVSPYLDPDIKKKAREYALNQINWILGLNPYDACMLEGIGRNNPDYQEGGKSKNYTGGICNGITGGFDNESDIAFKPLPQNDDESQRWRWSEQWIPHSAWFILAVSSID
jgi:hypothetical protein